MVKRQKLVLLVWSYYVVTLIPVLGIVQVGSQSMADRYTYLPSLGPFFIVALGIAWVLGKMSTLKRGALRLVVSTGIAVSVFVFLTYLTSQQIKVWKNTFHLWDYVIEKEPGKVSLAYRSRGVAFDKMGQLDKAISDYDKAIALNQSDSEAYKNRGVAFDKMGRLDKAIADYDKAIALNPSDIEAYDKAIAGYDKTTALNPRCYQAYNNKGKIYSKAGSFDKAIEQFNKAININPNYSLAYGNRGFAYFRIGEYARALKDLNKAIELDKNYAEVYCSRGNLYLRMGNKELALSDFHKACALGNEEGCNALQAVRLSETNQDR